MLSGLLNFIFFHTPIFYLIQSVWRDEAFSYFMAQPNFAKIIINTANDFNPPLYYLLLHFWMKTVGKEDIALRFLSFLPHIASVYIAYLFGEKLWGKKFAIFTALFTMFNPMLIYYAFEIRMYSLYAFLTFCSLYFFYLKKWRLFTVSTILGFYTHSFFALIPVSFLIYFWMIKKINKKNLFLVLKPLFFYLPWLPVLGIQFLHSKNSWLFPADLQLIKSVLGNLFTNYEGTPGNWWQKTAILSFFILLFFLLAFKKKRQQALLLLTPIFVPLLSIIGYSIIRRPIYVNRYLIFITVFEIMAVSAGIASIKSKILRKTTAWLWLMFIIIFNIVITPYHKKTDFKSTFKEINKMAKLGDFTYAKTPIGFLESAYYYKYPDHVFILNPNNTVVPNYIGINVVFSQISKTSFPPPPSRTFLVADDASFTVIINQ